MKVTGVLALATLATALPVLVQRDGCFNKSASPPEGCKKQVIEIENEVGVVTCHIPGSDLDDPLDNCVSRFLCEMVGAYPNFAIGADQMQNAYQSCNKWLDPKNWDDYEPPNKYSSISPRQTREESCVDELKSKIEAQIPGIQFQPKSLEDFYTFCSGLLSPEESENDDGGVDGDIELFGGLPRQGKDDNKYKDVKKPTAFEKHIIGQVIKGNIPRPKWELVVNTTPGALESYVMGQLVKSTIILPPKWNIPSNWKIENTTSTSTLPQLPSGFPKSTAFEKDIMDQIIKGILPPKWKFVNTTSTSTLPTLPSWFPTSTADTSIYTTITASGTLPSLTAALPDPAPTNGTSPGAINLTTTFVKPTLVPSTTWIMTVPTVSAPSAEDGKNLPLGKLLKAGILEKPTAFIPGAKDADADSKVEDAIKKLNDLLPSHEGAGDN